MIDDDEATNFLHTRLLKKMNPEVHIRQFEDGINALEHLKNEDADIPDLILLDVNMPALNGWEFLDLLPEKYRISTTIILLSTYINESRKKEMDTDKFHLHFIAKPLSAHKLLDVLSHSELFA
ncbi:MAG: response regulator [Bacteroidetes bacterium]|nr:MAG: response regulator [Bacteroidota bacterium]